jgi:hypothetical protein
MVQPAEDKEGTDDFRGDAVQRMAKYGITRVRIDNFCYAGFRYTNLDDAIAEARRHPSASLS